MIEKHSNYRLIVLHSFLVSENTHTHTHTQCAHTYMSAEQIHPNTHETMMKMHCDAKWIFTSGPQLWQTSVGERLSKLSLYYNMCSAGCHLLPETDCNVARPWRPYKHTHRCPLELGQQILNSCLLQLLLFLSRSHSCSLSLSLEDVSTTDLSHQYVTTSFFPNTTCATVLYTHTLTHTHI